MDYCLFPNENLTGGGNAVASYDGLVVFININNAPQLLTNSSEFSGNFGSRNNLIKIENGFIVLEGKEYGPDDARCCTSIPTHTYLGLSNGVLTKAQSAKLRN